MASQACCVIEGLRPLRRREKLRRKHIAATRRRQQHLVSRSTGGGIVLGGNGGITQTAGSGAGAGLPDNDGATRQSLSMNAAEDEAATMDEIWRRQQHDRSERGGESTHQDSIGSKSDSPGLFSGASDPDGGNGSGNKNRSLEELASERLWEFVAGWCMVGCIFAGIALIMGANWRVKHSPVTETQWTFDAEEGDSLMDSIISHIMKLALSIKDFEDQLMEHGIFVFVVGINGFVLVRQQIFVRKRQYEIDLQGGMMVMEPLSNSGTTRIHDEENPPVTSSSSNSDTNSSKFSGENQPDKTELNEEVTYTQEILHTARNEGDVASTVRISGKNMDGSSWNSSPYCNQQQQQKEGDKDKDGDMSAAAIAADDDSPDFRAMSFLGWFNYLQIGILIIEFLQLFSFPLRELMEFYNQAAKTTAMYESAKGVLNVFQAATTHPGAKGSNTGLTGNLTELATQSLKGLHYSDGVLAFGNNTLFTFNSGSGSGMAAENSTVLAASVAANGTGTTITSAAAGGFASLMPVLDNATGYATPWNGSTQWITDNLPTWLPNITSLMLNSTNTATGETHQQLEDMKQKITNAATDAAMKGISTFATAVTPSSNDTLSPRNGTAIGGEDEKGPSTAMKGDGDIVMQVSVLYLPILSTFLSSAACQSQAIHAYAHERHIQQQEQARREGHGSTATTASIFNSIVMTLLDPASTVSHPATSLLCTGPLVRPSLYLAASLLAYTLAYLLFMVFLTSFERVPGKGEICFRPNGVAVLKNLGLLLAVDFLLIQSPTQRRFRGLVSISIMLAMACYTIRMKPCYWNKINYWRTFSFSCVLYASLLVALLCPSPAPDKVKGERRGGNWVMAPHLKMGPAWTVGGGPKVMLAWIAAGWVILIIVFCVVERVFLLKWTKKNLVKKKQQTRHPYPS
ncbi:hypothetical protein BG004_002075 [Podila humilis]|nr:hypothetical protein BG004_002075 [Podila humilis]